MMEFNDQQVSNRTIKRGRITPKKTSNPLTDGIRRFLQSLTSASSPTTNDLLLHDDSLPKRYTVYKPLLLLPANVFTSPPAWAEVYNSLNDAERQRLYDSIASVFQSAGVTHIALNAPIELVDSATGNENRMRSPAGLVPLYGDFGRVIDTDKRPDTHDFDEAFWVQTTQNGGIVQCWAPLYTMFSRGNVTEKARILGLGGRFDGLDGDSLNGHQGVEEIGVVDLYAGIGYFSFSYLRRGVRRVWGWELNGWSVEGLRRGCVKNGWGCKVVPLDDSGALRDDALETVVDNITDDDRMIVFHGDNKHAEEIMASIQSLMERKEQRGGWAAVRHVNLGLLPSSRQTWGTSLALLDREYGGWAHVHENVDIAEIDAKAESIVQEYQSLGAGRSLSITCDYIEKVKTYAPGVMHCVYDIHIRPV